MNRPITDFYDVKVDTKRLCKYFKKIYKGEDLRFALMLCAEVAYSFERFAKSELRKCDGTLLDEAMRDWDI